MAADRITAIEAAQRQAAEARDRAAWDQAEAAATDASYRAYLRSFPDGAFAAAARDRIAALTQTDAGAAVLQQAADGEAGLGLNNITRTMLESRLDALGLQPGRVDGQFDDDTRRAVRSYQTARDLPVTGYLSEQTVVRLLADTLSGLGGN